MNPRSQGNKAGTPANLALLGLKAKMIERLKEKNGVYYLYGAEDKYLEVFIPYDADKPCTTMLLTDLGRLSEYADEHINPWNWRRKG